MERKQCLVYTFVVKVVGMIFMHAHWEEFIRSTPKDRGLETPIEVQVETRTDWQGNPYKQKVIKQG